MYKKRRNLIGKNINNLPSVQAAMGLASTSNNKIHITESLTGCRKQLFGRINDFKRKNNYKYLRNANGKIMLKTHDSSENKSFVTHDEFEDYLEKISNSGKLRHEPPMIQSKSDGGWSISEYLSIRKMRLCQIHACVVSVSLVIFNNANVVT